MSRHLITPLALGGVVAACGGVAAAMGSPVWAAVLGASLALLSWSLEMLGLRRAERASFNGAVAVAVGGMVLRLAVVLGVLVVVGLLDRAAFPAAALSFLAAFTVSTGLRLFTFPTAPSDSRREVRSQ